MNKVNFNELNKEQQERALKSFENASKCKYLVFGVLAHQIICCGVCNADSKKR